MHDIRRCSIIGLLLSILPHGSASAATIYVKWDAAGTNTGQTWLNAYTSLQSALASAAPGDEIWVAAGTYKPTPGTDRSASFHLPHAVPVFGGFKGTETSNTQRDRNANPTLLSGDLLGNDTPEHGNVADNSFHVVTVGAGVSATLSDCRIKGGFDDQLSAEAFPPPEFRAVGRGGGVLNQGGHLTLYRCYLGWNGSNHLGGAIHSSGSLFLGECSLRENFIRPYQEPLWPNAMAASGASAIYSTGPLTAVNCLFQANITEKLQQGPQSATEMSTIHTLEDATFQDCLFSHGDSAIWGREHNLVMIRCYLASNAGAGIFCDSNLWLDSCLIAGNAWTGVYGGACTITNCTIAENARVEAGGLRPREAAGVMASSLRMTNSIVWGNVTDTDGNEGGPFADEQEQVQLIGAGTLDVTFSCIQGLNTLAGSGNIGLDPRFAGANYDLLSFSPCIDAGSTAAVPEGTLDLNGNPRVQGAAVDMGAHERACAPFVLSDTTVAVPENGTATFSIALPSRPSAPVQVTVVKTSGDPDLQIVSGASLNFDATNYATPQHVTLSAAGDPDTENGTATFVIRAASCTAEIQAWENDITPHTPTLIYVNAAATGANTGQNWQDALTDLQAALAIARTGDEIWVAVGTYKPTSGGDRAATFQLKPDVGIYGGFVGTENDRSQRDPTTNVCRLSGDLSGNDGPNFVNTSENSYHVVTAGGVTETAILDGFTITGGRADGPQPHDRGGGVLILEGSPLVRDCVISENSTGDGTNELEVAGEAVVPAGDGGNGGGIYVLHGSPQFDRCSILDNRTGGGGWSGSGMSGGNGGGGAGIYFDGSPSSILKLTGCSIARNVAGGGGNSEHARGGDGGGLYCNAQLQAHDCTISDNKAGVGGSSNANVGGPGGRGGGAYFAAGGASFVNCTLSRNEGGNGGSGLSGGPGGDGGAVYASVEASLTLAGCGLEQNLSGNSGEGTTKASSGHGGGVYAGGGLTIRDCVFRANATATPGPGLDGARADAGNGGAVYCEGLQMVDTLLDSNIAGDGGGGSCGGSGGSGGGLYASGAASIEHCTFIANRSGNAGIYYCPGVQGARSGKGGGLYIAGGTLRRCTIVGNATGEGSHGGFEVPGGTEGGAGGGLYSAGAVTLLDSLIGGNTTGAGGSGEGVSAPGGSGAGVWCKEGSALINCTLYGNDARGTGGGVFAASTTVVNCILWANRDVGGTNEAAQVSGTANVTYSCLQGLDLLAGSGNTGHDPLFVNPLGADNTLSTWDDNDLHLGAGSPCIDAGDDAALRPESVSDLDGKERRLGAAVDMGAYETGSGPGDFDEDADVDGDDFLIFRACGTGPGIGPVPPGCAGADFDHDQDVDADDFGVFQRCVNGPGRYGVLGCAG